MHESEARRRFASARVARMATVGPDGRPHLVPVTFAVADDTVCSAVDAKPKTTRELKRLRNVRGNPAVTLLVDHYDDDWALLWWVRVDGSARVEPMTARYADVLAAKYPQYVGEPPAGPVIAVSVTAMVWWSA